MRNHSKLIVGCFIVFASCTSKETPEKATAAAQKAPPSTVSQEQKSISYATHPERFVKATPAPAKFNVTDPKTAQEHFNVGVDADNHKQWNEAIEQYQKALELKPDWALAHYRLATDYKLIGRTNDAIAHWEQATRYDPKFFVAYNRLASTYRSEHNLQKAIENYTQLLQYPPAQLGAHYQIGLCYAELGERQKAREHLESYRQMALKTGEKQTPRFQKALRELQELEQ